MHCLFLICLFEKNSDYWISYPKNFYCLGVSASIFFKNAIMRILYPSVV